MWAWELKFGIILAVVYYNAWHCTWGAEAAGEVLLSDWRRCWMIAGAVKVPILEFRTLGRMIGVGLVQRLPVPQIMVQAWLQNPDLRKARHVRTGHHRTVSRQALPTRISSCCLFCSVTSCVLRMLPPYKAEPRSTPDLHVKCFACSKFLRKAGFIGSSAATIASSCDCAPSGKHVSLTDALLNFCHGQVCTSLLPLQT
jgi:hypothetical protein